MVELSNFSTKISNIFAVEAIPVLELVAIEAYLLEYFVITYMMLLSSLILLVARRQEVMFSSKIL